MEFVKVHGLGNDFILVNDLTQELNDYPALARRLCDRHLGIGADGLVLLHPSESASFKMRIFNSDGSEAEMCGNAIRCLGKYIFEQGLCEKTNLEIETKSGIKTVKLALVGRQVKQVEVDMGVPVLSPEQVPVLIKGEQAVDETVSLMGTSFKFTAVSMGNPHCVIFVSSLEQVDIDTLGPALENHPLFPNKTNVEFVEVISPGECDVVVWERGAGRTLACGTGACAVLVAGVLTGRLSRQAKVNLPGGDLQVHWAESGQVKMSGPAVEVFRGHLDLH